MTQTPDPTNLTRRRLGSLVAASVAGAITASVAGSVAIAQPAREGRIRILAYGASNTWGFLPVDPVERRLRRLPSELAWPGVCQQALGAQFEILTDALPGRTIAADRPDMASPWVSGAAFNGMAELPEALARNAPLAAVVVQLGSNDLLSDKSLGLDALVARYVAMARLITDYRFRAPLVDMAVPLKAVMVAPPAFAAQPNNPAWQADEARRAALTPLLQAAGEQHGFMVVDGAEAVPVPGSDGLHFGADAHDRLGRLVAAALRDLFPDQRPTP